MYGWMDKYMHGFIFHLCRVLLICLCVNTEVLKTQLVPLHSLVLTLFLYLDLLARTG